MAAKLIWNPDADVDTIIDDFYQKAFGPAADIMRRYYTMFDPGNHPFISKPLLARGVNLLNRAAIRAAEFPRISARLDDLKVYWRYIQLWWQYTHTDNPEARRKIASISHIGATATNTITYDWNEQFENLRITDPLGRPAESYALDDQGRVTSVTNIEGQTMSITYDIGDYVSRYTRFDGSSVTNTYDKRGRLARVKYPDETLRYTYTSNGLPQTAANTSGTLTNHYDHAGRLTNICTRTRRPPLRDIYICFRHIPRSLHIRIQHQQRPLIRHDIHQYRHNRNPHIRPHGPRHIHRLARAGR